MFLVKNCSAKLPQLISSQQGQQAICPECNALDTAKVVLQSENGDDDFECRPRPDTHTEGNLLDRGPRSGLPKSSSAFAAGVLTSSKRS